MQWLVAILLAQETDPYALLRERMEQSVALQQESVRKQAQVVHRFTTDERNFFTVPWPRSAPPSAAPAAASAPICDPVPPAMLQPLVQSAAARNGLPELLIQSVIRKESAGRPCAVSSAGALGLMQLMPATAEQLGVRDPFDPAQSIDGGSRFLRDLLERFGGDVSLALGAYNAGPHRIEQYGGLPPFSETRNYVSGILGQLAGLPGLIIPNNARASAGVAPPVAAQVVE